MTTYMASQPCNWCTFLNMKWLNKLFIFNDDREPWIMAANWSTTTGCMAHGEPWVWAANYP